MKHRHIWRTTAFWMLTLPDNDHFYEGFIAWECRTCGTTLWATGQFHQTAHAMSPDAWQRIAEQERRTETALGHAAAQVERHHVLATDRYDTFARRA